MYLNSIPVIDLLVRTCLHIHFSFSSTFDVKMFAIYQAVIFNMMELHSMLQ